MKRVFTFIGCALLAWGASAQSWQDALLYAENQYGGTARSVGMGNAMTAVGADLGSLTFNPAGSAVAGYSQFALTGGLSYSLSLSQGDGDGSGFADPTRSGFLRAKMPNVGFVLSLDTGRRHGLRRMSFGFVSNSTADYTLRMKGAGVNADHSYSGSLASYAGGYSAAELNGADWDIPWDLKVGYRSGIFGDVDGQYLGLTDWVKSDGSVAVLGPLKQEYGYQSKGFKHDMLINFGMDFSDRLYLGANLGIVTLAYGQSEYWQEAPQHAEEFPDVPFEENAHARFRSLQMTSILEARGTGVYFKAGLLWRPVAGLRLGAAIQTPTRMHITVRSGYSAEAQVDGVKLQPSQTPSDDGYGYTLVNPFRVNGGVAYSFGSVVLLSADYEGVHYGQSGFKPYSQQSGYYSTNPFADQNADIQDVLGWSHMLRAGLEVKPVPFLALRAGYNFTSSGQHSFLEWVDGGDGKEYLRVFELTADERAALAKHAFTFGLGYSSGGSFYADLAFRYRRVPNDVFIPYSYNNASDALRCAGIVTRYHLADALLTVGWRF